jgi:hypothetical protein
LHVYSGTCPARGFTMGCLVVQCANRHCDGDFEFLGCPAYEVFPGGCDAVPLADLCTPPD